MPQVVMWVERKGEEAELDMGHGRGVQVIGDDACQVPGLGTLEDIIVFDEIYYKRIEIQVAGCL
jgi:hypothetical protein